MGVYEEKSVGREPPFSEDLSAEAGESPLLEIVSREWLVKTQQAGKDLACAVVICKVWRLEMAVYLLAVPSCVVKGSMNSIASPKPCL
jgi:hypothetical protein